MNILIDTNIIINLEDNKIIEEVFSQFLNLALTYNCNIFYHKDSEIDISKDKDEVRRLITISKLKKYLPFPSPAIPTDEFIAIVGEKKSNDYIDNKLLYQVYVKYTDLFVTEDLGIHKKANKIGLENVLTIRDAVKFLTSKFIFKIPEHPSLNHVSLRKIQHLLSEPFFDSLRSDYQLFDDWFLKSAQKNRNAYIFKSNNEVGAILIYKEEKAVEHRLEGVHDDALKMCTFKVAETAFGNKLGELFLSKMFALCIEKRIPYLYLTVFEKHSHLIDLLSGFGFQKMVFINSEGQEELIYLKHLVKPNLLINSECNTKFNHPYYFDGSNIEKYVIPIKDKFYRTLFKDGTLRQNQLFDDYVNEIQGNTITKAYICASPRKAMQTGSILFFYASKKYQMIEPVGILESINKVTDFKELKLFVNKRTVFSEEVLKQMLEEKQELTVILFRLVYYLRNPIPFKLINELKSYANKFTTITSLHEEDYLLLKQKKYFDERYIIH